MTLSFGGEVSRIVLYEETERGGRGMLPPWPQTRDGRPAPAQSHISDALFERLSTTSFRQAGGFLSLSLSLSLSPTFSPSCLGAMGI